MSLLFFLPIERSVKIPISLLNHGTCPSQCPWVLNLSFTHIPKFLSSPPSHRTREIQIQQISGNVSSFGIYFHIYCENYCSEFVPDFYIYLRNINQVFVPDLVQKLNNNSHNKCKSKSQKKTRLHEDTFTGQVDKGTGPI